MSRVFCFKCKNCGNREQWPWLDRFFLCGKCLLENMVRDYKTESVGFLLENLKNR